mmetsp:Transcript_13861/g.32232  ORF Transcript_13861/g.32232 Transcript_13861/m.32232 type:complete len:109 (-) Transcript_13861:200-526(-)
MNKGHQKRTRNMQAVAERTLRGKSSGQGRCRWKIEQGQGLVMDTLSQVDLRKHWKDRKNGTGVAVQAHVGTDEPSSERAMEERALSPGEDTWEAAGRVDAGGMVMALE